MSLSNLVIKGQSIPENPWPLFVGAKEALDDKNKELAREKLEQILKTPGLESRFYLQSWHFLRQQGIDPEEAIAKEVLGVVVEVVMENGVDIVAVYEN